MFLVKVSQFDGALEYVFWHSDNAHGLNRKRVLEGLAKKIINEDRIQKADTLMDEMDEFINVKSQPENNISF